MNFKPNYIILIITIIILGIVAYLLHVNALYSVTHDVEIRGDIAEPHTINYFGVALLSLITLVVSYAFTILIQNIVVKKK